MKASDLYSTIPRNFVTECSSLSSYMYVRAVPWNHTVSQAWIFFSCFIWNLLRDVNSKAMLSLHVGTMQMA